MLVKLNNPTMKQPVTRGYQSFFKDYESIPNYLKMEFRFAEICHEMEQNGIYLDVEKCNQYISQLIKEVEEIDSVLQPQFPNKIKIQKPFVNIFKKDGTYKQSVQNWINSGKPYKINLNMNQLERWEEEPGNLNSPIQLRDYLLSLGWKPRNEFDAWNHKKVKNKYGKLEFVKNEQGQPIRTEPKLPKSDLELKTLATLSPHFKLVSDRLVRNHRLHSLEGYLKNVRSDRRIPMIISGLAATMRVKHKVVTNIPKAEDRVFFGKELRSVFCAAPGKYLVGCDVSGMEACMLAHYLGNQEFIDFIIKENFKYHKYFHEIVKDYVRDINDTKNLGFAFVFGAGDQKLGSMCLAKTGDKKQLGKEVRELLMKNVPNLKALQDELTEFYKETKAVSALDGRLVYARKDFALINTVCQSAGAIFAKTWTCIAHHAIMSLFPNAKIIIFYHDEIAYECDSEEEAHKIGQILKDTIKQTGEYLKLMIPMTGEYKIGKNWAEIH